MKKGIDRDVPSHLPLCRLGRAYVFHSKRDCEGGMLIVAHTSSVPPIERNTHYWLSPRHCSYETEGLVIYIDTEDQGQLLLPWSGVEGET